MSDQSTDASPLVSDIQYNRFSEPLISDNEDCEAIPFIKFIQSEGKFELNPEAGLFLQGLKDIKLGVVAVCGKYRTGKSYLLNKLFVEDYFQNKNNQANKVKENRKGFQVSPTINPCTKGLWIWKKVIYCEQSQCPMIVIDTEGLGAFDEDENHDAKIFLLALLLSSFIIYNSVGTIDETALNNLSLVINLSKKIQLKNKQETQEDVDELAQIFPSFLWVLRDFTLKLVDSDGNKISSRQYLENALKEQKGCSEAIEQKNRIRRLLKHFFSERDCCTLIRPIEREKDLQDLSKMKDNMLRKEFLDQLHRLKQKVMTKVKYKVMNGFQLNGPMILELANSYIKALNDGSVPNIENAWTNVCNFEQERAYKESIRYFQQQISFKIKECNIQDKTMNIKEILNSLKQEVLSQLKSNFLGENKSLDGYEKRLKQELKKMSSDIIRDYREKQDQAIVKTIENQWHEKIEVRCRRNEINSTQQLNKEIEELLTYLEVIFVHDKEQIEMLYRKFVQNKIYKVIDLLIDSNKTESQVQQRILEQKLQLSQNLIKEFKDEKKSSFEETQNIQNKMEQVRCEQLAKQKQLEQKIQTLESQLTQLQKQQARLNDKVMKDESLQVSTQLITIGQQTQQNNPEEDITLNKSINVSMIKEEVQQEIVNSNTLVEQNKQLYNEILKTLNSHNQSMCQILQDEFAEILKNNETLSKTIELVEKRCLILEKKCQKKQKYEELVKNCQRLQCKGCNKLYTPVLFVSHYHLCQKQQTLRNTLQESKKIEEADYEESSSMMDEQFLARIVDLKHLSMQNELQLDDSNLQMTVEYKFCVLYKGSIWYVNKSLQTIKSVMQKVSNYKEITPTEKTQIQQTLADIEKQEHQEDFQRISELIEGFFQLMHKKLLNEKLSLTDIHSNSCYLKEFSSFFEINKNVFDQSKFKDQDEELVQIFYDKTPQQLQYNHQGIHSTINLDGEKTVNDNSLQFVSFFSVAEELLLRGNLLKSQELNHKNDWRKSTGSSVVIQDKSHDLATISSKGTLPFVSVTNRTQQRSPFSNNKIKSSCSKSSCKKRNHYKINLE